MSLGNVLSASYGVKTKSNYLSDEDDKLMKEWKVGAFEVMFFFDLILPF